MNRGHAVLLFALVGFAGCGSGSTSSSLPSLGRSLGAEPAPASQAPAPVGDPPEERSGTVPPGQAAKDSPAPDSIAPSPRAALRRYALAYTNWYATGLRVHERELVSLAIGAARLAAEQSAASQGAAAELAANHVQNKGVILAIAPGQGAAHGQWVVVTQEQTTGAGAYAGLPASPHVTFARAVRVGQGWAVNEWAPRS